MKSEGFLSFKDLKGYLKKIALFTFFTTSIIDGLLLSISLYSYYVFESIITTKNLETILLPTGVIIVISLIMHFLIHKRNHILNKLSKIMDKILYEFGMKIGISLNVKTHNNLIGNNVINDIKEVQSFFYNKQNLTTFAEIPFAFFVLCGMFLISKEFFILSFTVALFYVIIAILQTIKIPQIIKTNITSQANYINPANLNKLIDNYAQIKNCRLLYKFIILGLKNYHSDYNNRKKIEHKMEFLIALSKIVKSFFQITLLVMNVYFLSMGKISIGKFIIISITINRALYPFENLVILLPMLHKFYKTFSKIAQSITQIQISQLDMPVTYNKNDEYIIKLHNVNYMYQNSSNFLLKNISFNIKANKIYGIIGKSGSGKTTLLKLLSHFIEPNQGKIIFNNNDVHKENMQHRNFSIFIPEESKLFIGTIIQNITLFSSEPKLFDVIDVAKILNFHQEIINLPNGYNTYINDEYQFSPSFRKKISLAAAIFSNSKVIILDNPSAYFDSDYDRYFANTIMKYIKNSNKTLILSTNKKEIFQNLDHSIIIDDGKITKIT